MNTSEFKSSQHSATSQNKDTGKEFMVCITTYPNKDALAYAAAEQTLSIAQAAIAEHGVFTLALAGGSTPRALYTLLATGDFAGKLDWSRCHLFWGDERSVPPDHDGSNYRMVNETLLAHIQIPESHIHRIYGELEPRQAAAEYEQELRDFFTDQAIPRFDLILLGMGEDGHTASLFPKTKAVHEQKRLAVANYVEKLKTWRITLTPVTINAAAHIMFFVSGEQKAEALYQVLHGSYQPDVFPSQMVQPVDGQLWWMIDQAAAQRLDPVP